MSSRIARATCRNPVKKHPPQTTKKQTDNSTKQQQKKETKQNTKTTLTDCACVECVCRAGWAHITTLAWRLKLLVLSSYVGSGGQLDFVARSTFTYWASSTFIFLTHDLETIKFKKLLVLFLQFMISYMVKLLSTELAANTFELSNLKTRISVYTV